MGQTNVVIEDNIVRQVVLRDSNDQITNLNKGIVHITIASDEATQRDGLL